MIWARAGWGLHLCPPGVTLDLQLWHHTGASTIITQQHGCANLGQDKLSKNAQMQSQIRHSVHIHVQKTQGRGEGSGVETEPPSGRTLLSSDEPTPCCLSLFRAPSFFFFNPSHVALYYFGFCYFFSLSLTSVCLRCLTNECVRKCFIFPNSDEGFIPG